MKDIKTTEGEFELVRDGHPLWVFVTVYWLWTHDDEQPEWTGRWVVDYIETDPELEPDEWLTDAEEEAIADRFFP